MNTVFARRLSILLSVTAITVVGNGLSAGAETISTPAPRPGTTATSAAALTRF